MEDEKKSRAELLEELRWLRARDPPSAPAPSAAGDTLDTVSVPEPFRETFAKAQDYVARYFRDRIEYPQQSTILISGERYILVRAASMSVEFLQRKRMEESLRTANDELEERVRERTAALAHANQALRNEIAERERLEQQLLHAQKLESIGRLAGGVAHDFNNLLTAIIGYIELAELQLTSEPEAADHSLKQIREAATRATHLTRQLLAFARRQVIEPRVVDLSKIVRETDVMLRRLIGEHIELVTQPRRDLWPVRVDPGQIEQVLINLAVNARDAMPTGGKLTITTENAVISPSDAALHRGLAPGDYVVIRVDDTGTGMTDEVKARLFEPFFTTKPPGKGTGLGLATCYGIAQQNGGYIGVESEPGRGSSFHVYVPRVHAEPPPPALEPRIKRAGGTETILLVEDEPLVRAISLGALRAEGYAVLEASDGVEALSVAASHVGRIHLLLTDVIMPKIGGRQLAEALRATRPDVRVLFTSGYAEDAIDDHGVLDPGIAFIEKPFTPRLLVAKVRAVLDAPAPDPRVMS